MKGRPSRFVIAIEVAMLVLAGALAVALSNDANWDLWLFGILLVFSATSDLRAVEITAHRVKISGSMLAIIAAIALLGVTPAVLIATGTILAGWVHSRYAPPDLLINLVTYAWFPLLTGWAFHEIAAANNLESASVTFELLVVGLFVSALVVNTLVIASYSSYVEGSSLLPRLRRSFLPLIPSEIAAALLTVLMTYSYVKLGLSSVALFGLVLLTFQYLVGELLLSQARAEELEVRARQLAGFQVALLGALLRTLDLRDRMTARHSAAVARYSRELALRAGLSEDDQELAHTAGLLHDIGKFVLPDKVLKARGRLTPEDWDQIKRHPYEGARIVSQIDGYRPVGEVILAHHERLDGLGYPRGLVGDQVSTLARIVSIADTYDAMTARDSYGTPKSSFEAIAELRRVSGTQLDGSLVDLFVEMLADKDLAYRHGEDADFEAELALDKRIHDFVDESPIPI